MSTIEGSATARPDLDEDWGVEGILDELGISDDPGEGSPEPEDDPAPDEGSPDPEVEAPAGEEADPEEGDEAPDAPADEAPDPGAENVTDSPAPPAARPFTFKVDEEEVAPDGAYIVQAADGEEMVVMPLKVFQDKLRPNYLASRPKMNRQLRAKDLEIQELREQRAPKEEAVGVLLDKLNELYESPDKLTAFLQNFEQEAPVMKAKAENARLSSEMEALKRGKLTPEQRIREEENLTRDMEAGLENWIDNLAASDEFKGLPLDRKGLFAMLNDPDMRDTVFVIADEDNPEMGVRKGAPAVHIGRVLKLMRREAQSIRTSQRQTTEVVRTAQANGNAVASRPRKPIPPSGRAAGSPTAAAPARAAPKTKQEWLASLEDED